MLWRARIWDIECEQILSVLAVFGWFIKAPVCHRFLLSFDNWNSKIVLLRFQAKESRDNIIGGGNIHLHRLDYYEVTKKTLFLLLQLLKLKCQTLIQRWYQYFNDVCDLLVITSMIESFWHDTVVLQLAWEQLGTTVTIIHSLNYTNGGRAGDRK